MCPADSTAAPLVVAGHYRIIDLLGEGGWSRVYRALDLNLQREVALKRLRPERFSQPDSANRLMREARAASRLSHPNIVTVFDAFEHEGTAWIVMELVDGATLREVLRLRGSLGVEEILRYAEELTSALGTAHSAGLLHRDLTPRNVLISRDGRARLTDFGLACGYLPGVNGSEAATVSTASALGGKVVGTPGYMSPEQLLGRPVDPRSDLFSLGLLLYEMCTGQPAFSPASGGDLYDAVLHHEPVAIGRLNYEIPEELDRIVHKAIVKRLDERYQSAADLLADVRHLRRSVESGSSLPVVERRGVSRRTLLGIAVSVVAVIGLAAGLYQVWQWLRRDRLVTPVSQQMTSAPGWEARPALSPDGDLVAYSSNQSGNPEIWVLDAGGAGDPLRLTDDSAVDDHPAWYPDGSSLAFVSNRGGGESIWKVPRLGGVAIPVLTNAVDPAISPDGKRIAFARKNGAGAYRIGVAPLGSPVDAVLLTGDQDGAWDHREPAWSPDGERIIYGDFRRLWLVPAAGGPARALTSGDKEESDFDPVWSPGSGFIYFTSYRDGTLALWRISAEGGEVERMTLGTGPESQPSVSRDGSRLAYSTYADNSDIALLDRVAGTRRRIPGARRENESAFAPGGSGLLFVSNRLGTSDLWFQPLAGGALAGAARRFTDLPGSVARPGYSPDGAWISIHRAVDGKRDIWILPSGGGPPTRFTEDPAQDFSPSWSPTGSEIAFISDRDGLDHVWVAPVSGGRPAGPARRVSSGPGVDMLPVWSPDAREIAFMRADESGSDIWVVPAAAGGPPRRVTTGADAHYLALDAGSGALFVSGIWGTGQTEIRRVDMKGGRVSPMAPPLLCGGAPAVCAMSVSPDGRNLAFMFDEERGDLWMLRAAPGKY